MALAMGQSYVVILANLHLGLWRISSQHRYIVQSSIPLFSFFLLYLFSKWSVLFILMMRFPILTMHLLFPPLYKRFGHVDLTCHHPYHIIMFLLFWCWDRPMQTYLHFGNSRLLQHQSTYWHFISCYYLLMSEHWTYFFLSISSREIELEVWQIEGLIEESPLCMFRDSYILITLTLDIERKILLLRYLYSSYVWSDH